MTLSAVGYPVGTTFETHGAADGLETALWQLGTKYSAIVVGSDFGGMLTQAELDILDAHQADIINFLNAGGGLYGISEGSGCTIDGNSAALIVCAGRFRVHTIRSHMGYGRTTEAGDGGPTPWRDF
jgi:hypothetical protein